MYAPNTNAPREACILAVTAKYMSRQMDTSGLFGFSSLAKRRSSCEKLNLSVSMRSISFLNSVSYAPILHSFG